jgi:hypothetical protein
MEYLTEQFFLKWAISTPVSYKSLRLPEDVVFRRSPVLKVQTKWLEEKQFVKALANYFGRLENLNSESNGDTLCDHVLIVYPMDSKEILMQEFERTVSKSGPKLKSLSREVRIKGSSHARLVEAFLCFFFVDYTGSKNPTAITDFLKSLAVVGKDQTIKSSQVQGFKKSFETRSAQSPHFFFNAFEK